MGEHFFLIVGGWLVCGVLGAIIASGKNAGGSGFALGVLFGPLGLLAAFAVDRRRQCDKCGGRVNGAPEVCQRCGADFPRDLPPEMTKTTAEEIRAEEEYVQRLRSRRQ